MNNHEKIKSLRLQKRLSQLDISEALEMSQSAYAQLESGKTEITLNRLEQLAKIFGMTAIELLQYGGGTVVESVKKNDELSKILGFNLEGLIKDARIAKSRVEILARWISDDREVYEKLNNRYLEYQQLQYEQDIEARISHGMTREEVLAFDLFKKDTTLYKANYEKPLQQFFNLFLIEITPRISNQLPNQDWQVDFKKLLDTNDFKDL